MASHWYAGAFPTGEIIFGQSTSQQAYGEANPGVYVAVGPFATETAAEQWVNAHASTWPPPVPKGKQPSGGGGKPSPPSAGGGTGNPWWIEYIVAGGGSGGLAVPKVVQAATAPASGGDIEWVFGPYKTRAAAQAAAKNGPPSGNPVTARGFTDNSSTSGGGALAGLTDFVGRLEQASTWVRVAEVVLGVALLGIGLARITGTDNAIASAVKNIKVVPV